jgi:hypothetical protein
LVRRSRVRIIRSECCTPHSPCSRLSITMPQNWRRRTLEPSKRGLALTAARS